MFAASDQFAGVRGFCNVFRLVCCAALGMIQGNGIPMKIAIVTGASRGIGRAIAQELAKEQMRLVLVARSGDLLHELAASIGGECLVHVADLGKVPGR